MNYVSLGNIWGHKSLCGYLYSVWPRNSSNFAIISYNSGHNILGFCYVLVQARFVTSKTKLDVYYKKLGKQVAKWVAKWLKKILILKSLETKTY